MNIGPSHFINRELSWLAFNQRVLEEAFDNSNPLLERLKFFTIFSNNLDEFFEVRVAELKQQVESGVGQRGFDGLTTSEVFKGISQKVRELIQLQYQFWHAELVPGLARKEIRFVNIDHADDPDKAWCASYYAQEVRPVLTPLAIDSAHPFPQVPNKSLNLIIQLDTGLDDDRERLSIMQVPRVLPLLVKLPRASNKNAYLFLDQLIGKNLENIYPGMTIIGYWMFRVTRNSELYIDEEETDNLLKAVENELHKRRRGAAVRLEVQKGCPKEIVERLLENLNLDVEDLYEIDGPLNPVRLMPIYNDNLSPELQYPVFIPKVPSFISEKADLFELIRTQDIMLHHPFDSFEVVVDFLERAAEDPHVLAIKQTLYRTGGDSRIIGALQRAVNQGKQVTAVVELRARFDEANNIEWARRLEEAGVHVVYGLVGYKIHAKMTLVVRRENLQLRRYVHISTGNYNPITSRFYTDVGIFTCHPDIAEDATNLFNLLTGICQYNGMRKFLVSPFDVHEKMLKMIEQEANYARQGLPARIIVKLNALVEQEIIEALYVASQAGVKIDLIVRGICCLRPKLKRISENIRVISIVDRFLEHSRIYYFENGCQPKVYIGSADWMARNFFRRIEIVLPVEDGVLRERIIQEILKLSLTDNVRARELGSNGKYQHIRPKKGEEAIRSQFAFMALTGWSQKTSKAKKALKMVVRTKPTE